MESLTSSWRIGFTVSATSFLTLLAVYFYQELTEPCENEYAIPNYMKVANLGGDSPCSYLKVPGTLDTMLSSWQDFTVALTYINKEKWEKVAKISHSDLGVETVRSMSLLPTKLKSIGEQVATTVRVLQISPPNSKGSVRFLETAKRFVKDKSFHLIPISTWLTPSHVIGQNGTLTRVEISDIYVDYIYDLQTHELLENVFPMRVPLDKAFDILECSGVTFHILYITTRDISELRFALKQFPIFVEEGGYMIGDLVTNSTNWKANQIGFDAMNLEMFSAVQSASKVQGSLDMDAEFWAIKIRNQII